MGDDNPTASGDTKPKFSALSLLTTIQRLPTPFISAFMLVHLSAPLIANIGGSSASSQVMASTYFLDYRFCAQNGESDNIGLQAPGPRILSRAIYRICSRIRTSRDTCCLLSCAAYPSQYQTHPRFKLFTVETHSRKILAQTQIHASRNTLGVPGSRLLRHSRQDSQTPPFNPCTAHFRTITFRTGLRVCQVWVTDISTVGLGNLWGLGVCGALPCQ